MIRGLLLVPALLAASVVAAAASNGFADPSPNILYQLQKQNRGQPWLRVATDSSRWTLRALRVDDLGLGQLRARGSDPLPPDPMAWRTIRRIDEVVTREGRGRFLGFLVVGLAGAGLGNALGAPDHQGGKDAVIGLAVFGSAGAWLGGRFGARFIHDRPWYVAAPALTPIEPAPAAAEAPAETTLASLAPPRIQEPPPTSSSLSTSPRVLLACARIGRDDQIRVRADFGQFQGFAGVVGPQGMDGLRSNLNRKGLADGSTPAGLVTWDRIERVDKRGSSVGKGALVGGVAFACFGGLVGAAAVSIAQADEEPATAFIEGAAVGGAIGAALGGLIGAAIPGWHPVYRRR